MSGDSRFVDAKVEASQRPRWDGWLPDSAGTLILLLVGAALWMNAGISTLIVTPILVGALAVAAWSPAAAVAACLIASPTAFHLHSLPWGRFSLLEIAIWIGIGGYALRRLIEAPLRGWFRDVRTLATPVEIALPVLALLAVAGVSLTTLANPEFLRESVREVRVVIVGPVVFLCFARLTWQDAHARRWAAFCLVGVGAVVAALATTQVGLGVGGVETAEFNRATVIYPHPNNLALFLERTALFTAAWALTVPRSWVISALLLIQVIGVFATLSRGALLALVVGTVVLLWWHRAAGMLRLVGLAAGAVVTGFALFARDRLLDLGGSGDEPTRFALWRGSIRMIQDASVTGLGPDQFLYQYWRRYTEPAAWPERYTAHPHNLVLDIWLRLGVAGLAVAAWLVAGISREVWRIRRGGTEDWLAPGALAAVTGGLAHGLVDNGFFLPDLAVLTWAFVAWLITARSR